MNAVMERFQDQTLSKFENQLEGENQVLLHYHNRVELIRVVSGRGIISRNLIEYEVKTGDMVAVAPNEVHSARGYVGEPLHCQTLVCGEHIFAQMPYTLEPVLRIGMGGYDMAYRLHQMIFDSDTQEINAHLLSAMGELFRKYGYCTATATSPEAARLKLVLDYIHSHLEEKISVDTLAQVAGYSKYHFLRYFSTHTGCGCTQYITRLRVEQAKKYLEQTQQKLDWIANRCGFDQTSYFIKVFRKQAGQTPHQYRKQICKA